MTGTTFKQVLEAILFAADRPLLPKEIVALCRAAAAATDDETVRAFGRPKEAEVAAVLQELKIDCDTADRTCRIVERAAGWQMVTAPTFAPWVRELYPENRPTRLSGPSLETLAIIAYRQPVTRADIEAVRGVAVDGVVQSLLERGLIRICGRAEVPGRPLLYATTEFFMDHFGLRDLDELPNCDELRRMQLPTATPAAAEPAATERQLTLAESAPAAAAAEAAAAPATDGETGGQPDREAPVGTAAAGGRAGGDEPVGTGQEKGQP